VKLHFRCPSCERRAVLELEVAGPSYWQCGVCEQELELPPAPAHQHVPAVCVLCGNSEFYKKKNFPHWLGLTILTVASVAFLAAMARHEPWWAWAFLIGSAAFDGLLYWWVGDVILCYRCAAQYSGIEPGPEHKPFELATHERYRQERLRREQLKK
jgi:hypothetical protein